MTPFIITREDAITADACKDGLAWAAPLLPCTLPVLAAHAKTPTEIGYCTASSRYAAYAARAATAAARTACAAANAGYIADVRADVRADLLAVITEWEANNPTGG